MVNNTKIGEVEIRRTFSDLTGPGVHRYVWYLRTSNRSGRPCALSSIVDHPESDGALALIRTVLNEIGDVPLHAGENCKS
ncbi:hypothetical protein [Mycolicibacterium mageritense]|nr:hypothetical protein [Mycolicibacterium mageritense]